ncbi:MAG TPA: phosphoketolase family protein, partial [Negativicutes bacterium]
MVKSANIANGILSAEEIQRIDAYWRASLYLCVGMIFLKENPLLIEPLKMDHIKKRLLGHWGTDPGQAFTWVHLNRIIKKYDLNMVFISGPGHGAPATLANAYLEGTYSEVYPDMSEDRVGMQNFFKQFSFPGGSGSHCTPETPGSIHEGGELGYSISHAFGVAFDKPDLIVAVMVGDGEAETGPLAASWHSNKFLNPIRDGAVLPILHLNGYKIANPTILGRISHNQLESLFIGYGYKPYFVEGSDPEAVHQVMAQTLETVIAEIKHIQLEARSKGFVQVPQWPMIVLRTPKGWTGPKEVEGHKVEGSWRAHQVPFEVNDNSALKLLDDWLRSYKPEELFDETGKLIKELKELAPTGPRRMSANPITNGGLLLKPLRLPDFRDYAVEVIDPGTIRTENTHVLGVLLRDVMRNNMNNFRIFCPDETASNRLTAIYEATKKTWMAEIKPEDADGGELSADGRVMEMLSEHTLEGWLEGYLLSGRHGLLASYEAFIHVIDSMFNQHAKWLAKCREVSWRASVSSLNILVTSTVWRQDHNGFSHQDPGFLDVVSNKSPNVTRIYLPPDANCLLSVADHCLRSTDYVNVIVA